MIGIIASKANSYTPPDAPAGVISLGAIGQYFSLASGAGVGVDFEVETNKDGIVTNFISKTFSQNDFYKASIGIGSNAAFDDFVRDNPISTLTIEIESVGGDFGSSDGIRPLSNRMLGNFDLVGDFKPNTTGKKSYTFQVNGVGTISAIKSYGDKVIGSGFNIGWIGYNT